MGKGSRIDTHIDSIMFDLNHIRSPMSYDIINTIDVYIFSVRNVLEVCIILYSI